MLQSRRCFVADCPTRATDNKIENKDGLRIVEEALKGLSLSSKGGTANAVEAKRETGSDLQNEEDLI